MGNAKFVCGDRRQNLWFCALLVAGGLLANTLILAPLHESGHKQTADLEGNHATITGPATTQIDVLTPANLAAGYGAEVYVFLTLAVAYLLFTSPHPFGFRQWYFPLGFFLGYATWSWLTPLVKYTSDFHQIAGWRQAMTNHWLFDPGFFLLLVWLAVFFTRLKARKSLPAPRSAP